MMPPEAVPTSLPPHPLPVFEAGEPLPRHALGKLTRVMAVPVLWMGAFVVPPPATHHGKLMGLPSLCLFYRITGWPCPGCGLTRSCVCFAHGRWAESVVFHPLGPLVFGVMGLLMVLQLPVLRDWGGRLSPFAAPAAYVATGLFITVWLARLFHLLPLPPLL